MYFYNNMEIQESQGKNMIVQIFEKQEERKAKKKYEENIGIISDLDDVCSIIDDIKYRISNIDYEDNNRHVKELGSIQDEIIDEMKFLEDENLEIEEVWEE